MIFTRSKENKVHSTQAIITKIPTTSTSDKALDAFLHEAFWHTQIIYGPMLEPHSWVLLSALSDNGSICVIRECKLRPVIQHVPQNNTWTLIFDQTILKSHICVLKRRHCLHNLGFCCPAVFEPIYYSHKHPWLWHLPDSVERFKWRRKCAQETLRHAPSPFSSL